MVHDPLAVVKTSTATGNLYGSNDRSQVESGKTLFLSPLIITYRATRYDHEIPFIINPRLLLDLLVMIRAD